MDTTQQRKKRKRSLETGDNEDDKFFMEKARSAAKKSGHPKTKVGAIVVSKENDIIGTGYNRMPDGTEGLPWTKDKDNPLDSKHLYVCHAELNAIMKANMTDLSGCTIYTTLFPCNECAKIIIQAGIKKVIYVDMYHDRVKVEASKRMFDLASVNYSEYESGTSPSSGGGNPDLLLVEAWSSKRKSKDPKTQVGAIVVTKENETIGKGYNRMPNGTEGLPWTKDKDNPLDNKYMYVCHAEMNAIMDIIKGYLRGCTIYTTLFPSNECAKIIIQAGITQVVYLSDEYHDRDETEASRRMFHSANVKYRKYPATSH